MCGICATYGIDDPSFVRRMTARMDHRGPDDEGFYTDNLVSLGMRRLSIIDLSPSGHQPISNEDGTVWIVFNGEIYNHGELREKLLKKGHVFKGTSDTEVIVHLYEDSGPHCLPLLRGMFALIVWDRRTETLMAARDPMGIKPLYFAETNGRLLFASELQSLMASGIMPRDFDPDALCHYLSFGSVPAPQTIWRNVRSLMPGERLLVHGGSRRNWRVPTGLTLPTPDSQDSAALLRGQLEESVRLHLVSDVPVGAFLSGGLDSSIIVALASQISPYPMRTFSVGFPDARPSLDERHHARLVAERYGTDHTEVLVTADDAMAALPDFVGHLDQPSNDALNTYLVAAATRGHVKTALSGMGGDELFGGYSTMQFADLLRRRALLRRLVPPPVGSFLARVNQKAPIGLRTAWLWRAGIGLLGALPSIVDQYAQVRLFISDEEKGDLLRDGLQSRDDGSARSSLDLMTELLESIGAQDPRIAMAYLDINLYMMDTLLRDTDSMSMAHSLEVRVPYLDLPLVNMICGLPPAVRWPEGQRRKALLLAACGDLLLPPLLEKKKAGFALPLDEWLRSPSWRALVDDCLSRDSVERRGILRYEAVRRIYRDFYERRHFHANQGQIWQRLWLLVVLELWMRGNVDRAPSPTEERERLEVLR